MYFVRSNYYVVSPLGVVVVGNLALWQSRDLIPSASLLGSLVVLMADNYWGAFMPAGFFLLPVGRIGWLARLMRKWAHNTHPPSPPRPLASAILLSDCTVHGLSMALRPSFLH